MEAVRQSGDSLEYASPELRNDPDVVLEAVRNSPRSIRYASTELRNDRDFVVRAMIWKGKTSADLAKWLPTLELREDREFMLRAAARNSAALQFASKELRSDPRIVLAAIETSRPWSFHPLQHAPMELQFDRDFLLAVAQTKGGVRELECAPEYIWNDRDVVLAAVKNDAAALKHASGRLRGDREIVLAAVQNCGYALQYASEGLRGDREVVLAAVKTDGVALEYASEDLRGDREVVFAAVKKSTGVLRYASFDLQCDEELAFEDKLKYKFWNQCSPQRRRSRHGRRDPPGRQLEVHGKP